MIKKFIRALMPLPSVKHRKLWLSFIYRGYIKEGIKIKRDSDYILYQFGSITERIGYTWVILLLIDVLMGFDLLIDTNILSQNNMAFVGTWGLLMGPVVFLAILISYLRVRLFIDLKNDQIPFFIYKKSLRGKSRREWIGNMVLVSVAFGVMFPVGFFFAEKLFHFNDLFRVSLLQWGYLISIPFCVSVGASSILILEKAIRFFPEVNDDLENW